YSYFRGLYSFPTRRSSDLDDVPLPAQVEHDDLVAEAVHLEKGVSDQRVHRVVRRPGREIPSGIWAMSRKSASPFRDGPPRGLAQSRLWSRRLGRAIRGFARNSWCDR